MNTIQIEEAVVRQALEALGETRNALAWFYDSYPEDVTPKGNELLPHVEVVLADLRVALTSNSRALEQPAQQEPVACVIDGDLYFHHEIDWEDLAYQGHGVELLYTHPAPAAPVQDCFWKREGYKECPTAQRQWVGLTKLERRDLYEKHTPYIDLMDAIEAKLKEKNQ